MRDPRDARPQGEPDTVILLPHGSLVGLHIRGVAGGIVLGIREDAEGQPISCAEVTRVQMETALQSNPRRRRQTGWA